MVRSIFSLALGAVVLADCVVNVPEKGFNSFILVSVWDKCR